MSVGVEADLDPVRIVQTHKHCPAGSDPGRAPCGSPRSSSLALHSCTSSRLGTSSATASNRGSARARSGSCRSATWRWQPSRAAGQAAAEARSKSAQLGLNR